jgi:hypothetical protein
MPCLLWIPGRVAAAFATANGDPNKIHHMLTGFLIYAPTFYFQSREIH